MRSERGRNQYNGVNRIAQLRAITGRAQSTERERSQIIRKLVSPGPATKTNPMQHQAAPTAQWGPPRPARVGRGRAGAGEGEGRGEGAGRCSRLHHTTVLRS